MMPEPKSCAMMRMLHDGDINRDASNVMKDSPIVAHAGAED